MTLLYVPATPTGARVKAIIVSVKLTTVSVPVTSPVNVRSKSSALIVGFPAIPSPSATEIPGTPVIVLPTNTSVAD